VSEILVFGGIVVLVAAGSVVVGMLLVPRLERLTDEPDEEHRDGDDPAAD